MDEFSSLEFQLKKFNDSTVHLLPVEQDLISKALQMAQKCHERQVRKSGLPYLIHPLRVALVLMNETGCKDPDLICAALLHDVIEDTPIHPQEIKGEFGEKVFKLVNNLSKSKDEKFADYLERVYQSGSESVVLKFCDRLDNARDMMSVAQTDPGFVESQIKIIETYFLPYCSKNLPYFFTELQKCIKESKTLLEDVG